MFWQQLMHIVPIAFSPQTATITTCR